ncbi:DUF2637 domain-containing protein [Streptomyces silvensis]|uniref:DUF2637 domain-containing protein n=1 Tax=Streptomyces silvensis TaxID=1765722 RepID=A0A0W7X352_9ACTN|nr:DUF2637 domain-containing protein [Streptomyces silvensis]KUF17337.1 hypothetical protein AT728_16145 [Streptomyces silvensis]
MTVDKLALPAGIAVAALCVLAVVALVLRSRRSREQDKLSAEERERLAEERRKTWRRRLAVISLSIAFVIIFCIAGIAAWLSFGAQKAYAFDRNGGSWDAATGFALLLDAGALGLSLLRLFEALTARSSQLTRFYLVAFIVASATMNLLHAPHAPGEAPSLGGRLVAVIPPLVYAVFLETLLKKVEQLILGKYPKRKKRQERGYSLLLWVPVIGYPWKMWKRWRADLHDTLENVRAPGSRKPLPAPAPEPVTIERTEPEPPRPQEPLSVEVPHVPQLQKSVPAPRTAPAQRPVPAAAAAPVPSTEAAHAGGAHAVGTEPSVSAARPPATAQAVPAPAPANAQEASNKPKKEQLRDALVEQIVKGDLRVLDSNAQVSNAAGYRANMALGRAAGLGTDTSGHQQGLMQLGSVRNAVKQLLPELRKVASEAEQARRAAAAAPLPRASEPVPEHQTPPPGEAEASREREEQAEPAIGRQRAAGASDEEKETVLASQ